MNCPFLYKMQYTGEIPYKSGGMGLFGQAVHETTGEWINSKMVKEDTEPLDKLTSVPDDKIQAVEAFKMFKKSKEMFKTLLDPTVVNYEAERKVALDKNNVPVDFFNKSAYFRGVVDLILYHEDGGVSIYDWKTGFKKQDFLQLNVYAYIMKEIDPFSYIKRLGYLYPRTDKISEGEPIQDEIAFSVSWIHNTAKKIEADKQFKPNFGKHCDYCEVVHKCPLKDKIPLAVEDKMELALWHKGVGSNFQKDVRDYCAENDKKEIILKDGTKYGINPKTGRFGEIKEG